MTNASLVEQCTAEVARILDTEGLDDKDVALALLAVVAAAVREIDTWTWPEQQMQERILSMLEARVVCEADLDRIARDVRNGDILDGQRGATQYLKEKGIDI